MSDADLECLDIGGVVELTGFKRATIYKRVRLRQFPQPIRLGAAVRWRKATILAWMLKQEKAAERVDAEVAALSA